jgi:hypothetical protein
MWRPELLLELERVGALYFIGHPGLRLALSTLSAKAEQAGAIDLHQLRAWIAELSESYTKRALLRALVEPPRVDDADLALHVESILDSLEIAALERHRSELEARSARSGDAEALRSLFDIRGRIEQLRGKRRTTTAGRLSTSGGAQATTAKPMAGQATSNNATERRDGALT